MAPAPIQAVLDAVNGPTTQVTSRMEIYESDGTTRWVGDTDNRLVDGSVSVDYSRDERRTFDLSLDNWDNALVRNPNGGFWYDKVLKIYKGITYKTEAFRNVYSNIRKNYAYNPSAEGISGTAVVRTNLFPNPHVANDTVGWNNHVPNGAATLSRQTGQSGWGYAVTTSVRTTYTTASTTVDGGILSSPNSLVPATAAKPYGIYMQVRCSKIQRLGLRIDFYSAGGYISSVSGSIIVVAANTVTDFVVTGAAAPASTTYAVAVLVAGVGTSGTVWGVGDWLEATNLHMEMTDATLAGPGGNVYTGMFSAAFSSGAYGQGDVTFTWAGTANASASQMRQPASAAFIPASGLTLGVPVSTEYAQGGSRSFKLIPDATGPDSYLELMNQTRTEILGKTLTISATIRVPAIQTGTIDGRARQIYVYVQAPSLASGVMQGYSSTQPANVVGTTTLNLTVTIPADSVYVSMRLYNGSGNPTSRVFWDSILVEQGTSVGTFFHGASADVGNTHNTWDGAQWASTSTQQRIDVESYWTDVVWENQIGEFVIDQLSEDHFPHLISVTGRDYTKRCLTSKFVTTTTFAPGQAIETLIRNIASLAGITKFLLPATGKTVGKTFTYERGTERWKAIKEIADSYSYELFFDGQGYLVMRPYRDPVYAALSVVLSTGQAGNLVTYQKSTNDTRVYNHIVVTGESSDSSIPPVFAEALNNEPSSPTRIARLGDRLYEYTSSFITTVAQCQQTASDFLKLHALEEYNFNFSSISYPWLEVGEIAQFIDPRPGLGDPDRFLLSSLTIPLKGGPMSGNAKRVTVVG